MVASFGQLARGFKANAFIGTCNQYIFHIAGF
jgi:hypothetical protein